LINFALLKDLYKELYDINATVNGRYNEFILRIYEIQNRIFRLLQTQLTYSFSDTETTEESVNSTRIIPYMLVTPHTTNTMCPICYEHIPKNEQIRLKCNHTLCNTCMSTLLTSSLHNPPQCVLCRSPICEIYTSSKIIYADYEKQYNTFT
jgi:hypothetical protein